MTKQELLIGKHPDNSHPMGNGLLQMICQIPI